MVGAAGDMRHVLALRNRSFPGRDRAVHPGFDDVECTGGRIAAHASGTTAERVEQFDPVSRPHDPVGGQAFRDRIVAEESRSRLAAASSGGPSRDRTGDLRHAMAALSQLSYGPRAVCSVAPNSK